MHPALWFAIASFGLALGPAAQSRANDTQPPTKLAGLSMGLRTAATRDLDLGVRCRAIDDGAGNARLVWAAKPDEAIPVVRERTAAAGWLATHAHALGFAGFAPTFAREGDWHDCTVWTFALHRDGLALFDAEVSLYFDGTVCLGLLSRTPRVVTLPAVADRELPGLSVLFALRDESGRIVVAELRETRTPTHQITEVVHEGAVLHRLLEQVSWSASPQAAVITEYTFPGMNYPDQIWADSKGLIWFSEPLVSRVSRFDPTRSTFRSYATTGYNGADGLQVDDRDRVWFGLINLNHGLGMIDAATGVFTRYAAPYTGAQLAVPTQTNRGTILVTDHAAQKICEFDPATATWLNTITMPAGSYPVSGTLEAETGDVYFPLYAWNGIGRWSPGVTSITRIPTPSASGPAFAAIHDGKVYISYGLTNRLGVYDTRSGTFADHAWRTGELGGPIAIAPNGHVVVGTRNRGYIAVFDPKTQTFTDYLIPTPNPGLKDGLTVAPDGVIWFTETLSAHKIAKLVLP